MYIILHIVGLFVWLGLALHIISKPSDDTSTEL